MIPISRDKAILWTDPDDGSVFEFQPAVGDTELILYDAFSEMAVDTSPFIDAAAAKIAGTKGKRWKPGEMQRAVANEARRMAIESDTSGRKNKFSVDETRKLYRAIDAFVLSCTPAGGKKEVFDGDASQHFNLVNNSKLLMAITQVNQLGDDDKKKL